MKTYSSIITKLEPNQIFVFGSNTQGRHGKGAALWARQHAGAIYGQARGLQGQSYAIVTKDLTKQIHPSISPLDITDQIRKLYHDATCNNNYEFLIAYKGDGVNLNSYTPRQLADMFYLAGEYFGKIPDNIIFEEQFWLLVNYRPKDIVVHKPYTELVDKN